MHINRYQTKHISTDTTVIKTTVTDSARPLFLFFQLVIIYLSFPLGQLVY